MPAPVTYEYSVAALVAAHTALRDLLDAQNVAEAGQAFVRLRAANAAILAVIPLAAVSGTINGATGQLTLVNDGREEAAPLGGTIAYGEFCDAAGAVHIVLPAQAGTDPVVGKIVVNTLTVVPGGPIELVGAVVG